jgi:hypothetical protein
MADVTSPASGGPVWGGPDHRFEHLMVGLVAGPGHHPADAAQAAPSSARRRPEPTVCDPSPTLRGGEPVQRYQVYGIVLASDLDLSWPVTSAETTPDLVVTRASEPPVELDWSRLTPAFSRSLIEEGSRWDLAYHLLPDLDVIRVRNAADHYIYGDRIVCHTTRPDLNWLLEIHLFGMVLALWLERRGVPTLHASAAVVGGSAVAFLGTKGGGKTTTATSLVAAGHDLLADDLLALDIDGTGVRARAGYPLLRLWPEQADHFLGGHEHLPLVHPEYTKRQVRVDQGLGRFRAGAVDLTRIYLPRRVIGDAPVKIERVPSNEALLALLEHSFLAEQMAGLGIARHRFEPLADVVRTVTVRRLRFPSGFDRLPDVVAAVEADLGG